MHARLLHPVCTCSPSSWQRDRSRWFNPFVHFGLSCSRPRMAHLWREEEGLSPVAHTGREILAWGCWAVAGISEACSSIFPLIRHKVCRWDELFRKGQPNTASSESRNWSHLFFTFKKEAIQSQLILPLCSLKSKKTKQKKVKTKGENKDWHKSE